MINNNDIANTKEHSLQIEVLLHASDAPLTDKALRKHLSVSAKELEHAFAELQQR